MQPSNLHQGGMGAEVEDLREHPSLVPSPLPVGPWCTHVLVGESMKPGNMGPLTHPQGIVFLELIFLN